VCARVCVCVCVCVCGVCVCVCVLAFSFKPVLLLPSTHSSLSWQKLVPYEIVFHTSNVKAAGTDANVFIAVYGDKGKTDEIFLRNKTDNFERGKVRVRVRVFVCVCVCVCVRDPVGRPCSRVFPQATRFLVLDVTLSVTHL
jgi:hypothetical protein